jgi:prephenate dehydrogenase
VAIIGVGLLGGSIALALKRARLARTIVGASRSRETLRRASALGVIDAMVDGPEDAARGAELVVVAAPVQRIPSLLERIAGALSPKALVTDVGSTKQAIVAAAERVFGPGGVHPCGAVFVGAHPLAGGERLGVQSARASLLDGAKVLVTPSENTPLDALERATSLWEALGAHVHIVDPMEHDRLLAATSHLPHATACALMRAVSEHVAPSAARSVSGRGLRDTTRVAASGAGTWTDILLENRSYVLIALQSLREELDALAGALETNDRSILDRWLDGAADLRRQMDAAPDE